MLDEHGFGAHGTRTGRAGESCDSVSRGGGVAWVLPGGWELMSQRQDLKLQGSPIAERRRRVKSAEPDARA